MWKQQVCAYKGSVGFSCGRSSSVGPALVLVGDVVVVVVVAVVVLHFCYGMRLLPLMVTGFRVHWYDSFHTY
jgi:succinate dehydrogenase/fumarate reductase cytochrome b subunit